MTKRQAVIGVLLGLVVIASSALVTHRLRALPRDAVLRYGDTVVTTADFDKRVAVLKAIYGVQPPARGIARARFNRDAAKSYGVSLVLDETAASEGIRVADSAASRELSSMVDEKLGGDTDAFIDFLAQAGLSRADVVDEVRRTIAARRLYAKVTAKVVPATTADARRTYEAQKASMVSPEQRTLRTIVVPTEAEAVRVRQQVDSGADFTSVARDESQDAVSKADGGLLGTLPQSSLEPAFGAAAFRADKGAVFGPVRGQRGWNVGRVDDIVPPRALTFAEAKDDIIRQLTAIRLAAAWDPWLYRQLRKADIEYADAYRPKDPYAAGADAGLRH
jgi:peptidyl-prolyl cis-trans isomerase C